MRILRPFRLYLRICPLPPQRLSTVLARRGWLCDVTGGRKEFGLCGYMNKRCVKLKPLAKWNYNEEEPVSGTGLLCEITFPPDSGSSCSNGVHASLQEFNYDNIQRSKLYALYALSLLSFSI